MSGQVLNVLLTLEMVVNLVPDLHLYILMILQMAVILVQELIDTILTMQQMDVINVPLYLNIPIMQVMVV